MFSGIIQAIGCIIEVAPESGDARVRIATGPLDLTGVNVGDSIAVNGVCLTAVDISPEGFVADVSAETMMCTTFGHIQIGQRVNLEKALTLATPLGGHLVSGHVDAIGVVAERRTVARSLVLSIETPAGILKYVAEKGSICIDGVSLTVNHVEDAAFEVNIVPHTLQSTTLEGLAVGARVNLEVDLIARYLERLLMSKGSSP